MNRQLHRLTPYLGSVDEDALAEKRKVEESQVVEELKVEEVPSRINGGVSPRVEQLPRPTTNGDGPADALLDFYNSFPPNGRDAQIDAALVFAYYLQTRESQESLGVGDLIRCCIRAGVDTRNFNRVLGTLTRRGFLEAVQPGRTYRLSVQGVAAVESRM